VRYASDSELVKQYNQLFLWFNVIYFFLDMKGTQRIFHDGNARILVSDIHMKQKPLTLVETFVGCGGAHLGFTQNGFKSLLVNDINRDMLDTLLLNDVVQKEKMFHGSVCDLRGNVLKTYISEPVDVLFGGIVCKGFSTAGLRNPFDKRNYLFREQLRLVEELRPKVSVIENVRGLKTMYLYRENDATKEAIQAYLALLEKNKKLHGGKITRRKQGVPYDDIQSSIAVNRAEMKRILSLMSDYTFNVFDEIQRRYEQLGYAVFSQVMDASDYGSFTRRKRLIIVAVRKDIEKQFHFPEKIGRKKTLVNALRQIDYEGVNHPTVDKANRPMKHSRNSIRRFSLIPEGKTLLDVMENVPKELQLSSVYSRGSACRLDRNKTVPTLVPGTCNFSIHPWEDRLITLREAATITGFPITYKFSGLVVSRYIQVGNAVPVHLADAIAKSVRNVLS